MRAILGSFRTLLVLSIAIAGTRAAASFTSIDLGADRLLLGDDRGGVTVTDLEGRPLAIFGGDGRHGATRASVDVAGTPFWITADGAELVAGSDLPGQVRRWSLAKLEMSRPMQRITRWKDLVVLHSANELRLFDPQFGTVHFGGDIFPPDVAHEARQGVCTTFWGPRGGLVAIMRRYGVKKESAGAGEVDELGLLSAWHCSPDGAWRYLGAYSCAVSTFKADAGPRVDIRQGEKHFSADFGTTDLSNVKVVAEGIVLADANDIIRVPFMKSSWLPDRLRTAISPKYAASLAVGSNVAWWLQDGKVIGSSLEDGDTDVYLRVGAKRESPRSIVAAESRLYALYGDRVEPLNDADGGVSKSWMRYEAGSDTAIARSRKHKAILASAKKALGSSRESAVGLFRKVGVSPKRIAAAMKVGTEVRDLELGDLVQTGRQFAIYVGNGKVQPIGSARSPEELALASDVVAYRIIDTPNIAPPPSTARSSGRISELVLLGVNRPNPSLGHSDFVRITSGTSYDRPYLDRHFQLQEAMKQYLGTPYAWGGNSHNGIDCSGFVCAAFREVGIRLPRHSRDIAHADIGDVVTDTLRYGDVLYYPGEVGRRHVAIYIGNGQTIEARPHGVDYYTVKHRRATIARRFITE